MIVARDVHFYGACLILDVVVGLYCFVHLMFGYWDLRLLSAFFLVSQFVFEYELLVECVKGMVVQLLNQESKRLYSALFEIWLGSIRIIARFYDSQAHIVKRRWKRHCGIRYRVMKIQDSFLCFLSWEFTRVEYGCCWFQIASCNWYWRSSTLFYFLPAVRSRIILKLYASVDSSNISSCWAWNSKAYRL